MREICTSGSARGEEGNLLAYSTAPAQGNGATLALEMIGIEGDIGIGETHFERRFAL
jgi:hypothetical protein